MIFIYVAILAFHDFLKLEIHHLVMVLDNVSSIGEYYFLLLLLFFLLHVEDNVKFKCGGRKYLNLHSSAM